MIERVSTTSIFVADQDRAKDFYTRVLGFELRTDAPLFPGATARWITVAPPEAETEVALYLPDENWEHYRAVVGQTQAVTFLARDLPRLVEDLKARSVVVVHEPEKQLWGTFALIQNSEGNRLLLVEPPSGA